MKLKEMPLNYRSFGFATEQFWIAILDWSGALTTLDKKRRDRVLIVPSLGPSMPLLSSKKVCFFFDASA